MRQFKLSNSILEKGEVVDVNRHKGKAAVRLPDGRIKEIRACSPCSENKSLLAEGEAVVLVRVKNAIEYKDGVRQHVLKMISYPGDNDYLKIASLEKKTDSTQKHPVDIALLKKQKKSPIRR